MRPIFKRCERSCFHTFGLHYLTHNSSIIDNNRISLTCTIPHLYISHQQNFCENKYQDHLHFLVSPSSPDSILGLTKIVAPANLLKYLKGFIIGGRDSKHPTGCSSLLFASLKLILKSNHFQFI